MKDFFEFTKRTEEASKKALTLAEKKFSEIDEITEYNQRKVLAAFINNRVDETDFNSTTGYGYNDKGREKLDSRDFRRGGRLNKSHHLNMRHPHNSDRTLRRTEARRYNAQRNGSPLRHHTFRYRY